MNLIRLLGKINLTKVLIGLLVIVSLTAYVEHQRNGALSKENHRLTTRVTAANDSLKTVKNGMYKQTTAIESTVNELRKYNSNLTDRLNKMDIRLGRLRQVQETGLAINAHVNASVYDSIRTYITNKKDTTVINNIPVTDTLKMLKYRDAYLKFDAIIDNNKKLAPVNISMRDSLTVAGFDGKRTKHILFIRYGPRKIGIRIHNVNPYVDITYNKTILIE